MDTTGSVEFGVHVVLEAFKHGKDVVLLNAELDATIGPILQTYADKHDKSHAPWFRATPLIAGFVAFILPIHKFVG